MAAAICCAPSVPSATHSTARLDQSAWVSVAGNAKTGRGWGNVALPGFRAVICACFGALSLAACSSTPLGRDVIAQANPDGRIAFDIVKLDDAVLATLLAHPPPAFPERFKQAAPPPALKIGPGDLVSVVIFESASNGLFGESLTEISLPPGAVGRWLLTRRTRRLGDAAANGLSGESLTAISLPLGAVPRRLLTREAPPLGEVAGALQQLSTPLEL